MIKKSSIVSRILNSPNPVGIALPAALALLLMAGTFFAFLMPSVAEMAIKNKKAQIVELTASAVSILDHFQTLAKQGKLTEKQARTMAAAQIRNMRYGEDNKAYFWIHDNKGTMVAHPYRKDLEGTDVSGLKDSTGFEIFRELTKAALEGDKFVRYQWQRNDIPGMHHSKLSFVQMYKPWGWVVGTGVYLDDVEAEVSALRTIFVIVFVAVFVAIGVLSALMIRRTIKSERKRDRYRSQREKLIHALREGEERYRTIADFAYDWEVWISPDGTMLYCSPSCERITGYPPEAFFERPELISEIIIPEDRESWDTYLTAATRKEGASLDFRILNHSGRRCWLGVVGRNVYGIGMKPLGLRFSFRDVTSRKHMENQLRHQALHDPLTSLANRTLALDRISQVLARSKRKENHYFAVVFLDLDRFKVINDSLGHQFGDRVLVETAHRLQQGVRDLDTVARFGGDEFVLLLDELDSPRKAIRIVMRIRKALSEPFRIDGHEIITSGSFGIYLSPTELTNPDEILQNSNIAMHRAKESGRNRMKVFTARMLEHARKQMLMENDMRRGLRSNEFYLEYQPILMAGENRVVGFEALCRWQHAERGPIAPDDFIPLAEDTGFICELGAWVINTSLQTLAQWQKEIPNSDDLTMAVNVSAKQFAQHGLLETVMTALHETGVSPECLKLEITESAIMANPENAMHILSQLRERGVQFSIDDFGTGYSSLTQLQRLPVDTLKVDRSFISRISTDSENLEIVRAIIALAHSLELDVVAEGVEENDQLRNLKDLSCEYVQGFLLHRPLAGPDAESLIKNASTELTEDMRAERERRKKHVMSKAKLHATS